jgi:hypothetical protein
MALAPLLLSHRHVPMLTLALKLLVVTLSLKERARVPRKIGAAAAA